MGYSEYGRFQTRRMFVEDGLDFAAVHLLTAGNDHVFDAVNEIKITVRILITEVPGAEEAVPKGAGSILSVLPVPRHDVCSPCHDLATLSRCEAPACLIHYLQINAGTRPATRHEPLRCMLLVAQSGQEPRLAQPVNLHQPCAGQK